MCVAGMPMIIARFLACRMVSPAVRFLLRFRAGGRGRVADRAGRTILIHVLLWNRRRVSHEFFQKLWNMFGGLDQRLNFSRVQLSTASPIKPTR